MVLDRLKASNDSYNNMIDLQHSKATPESKHFDPTGVHAATMTLSNNLRPLSRAQSVERRRKSATSSTQRNDKSKSPRQSMIRIPDHIDSRVITPTRERSFDHTKRAVSLTNPHISQQRASASEVLMGVEKSTRAATLHKPRNTEPKVFNSLRNSSIDRRNKPISLINPRSSDGDKRSLTPNKRVDSIEVKKGRVDQGFQRSRTLDDRIKQTLSSGRHSPALDVRASSPAQRLSSGRHSPALDVRASSPAQRLSSGRNSPALDVKASSPALNRTSRHLPSAGDAPTIKSGKLYSFGHLISQKPPSDLPLAKKRSEPKTTTLFEYTKRRAEQEKLYEFNPHSKTVIRVVHDEVSELGLGSAGSSLAISHAQTKNTPLQQLVQPPETIPELKPVEKGNIRPRTSTVQSFSSDGYMMRPQHFQLYDGIRDDNDSDGRQVRNRQNKNYTIGASKKVVSCTPKTSHRDPPSPEQMIGGHPSSLEPNREKRHQEQSKQTENQPINQLVKSYRNLSKRKPAVPGLAMGLDRSVLDQAENQLDAIEKRRAAKEGIIDEQKDIVKEGITRKRSKLERKRKSKKDKSRNGHNVKIAENDPAEIQKEKKSTGGRLQNIFRLRVSNGIDAPGAAPSAAPDVELAAKPEALHTHPTVSTAEVTAPSLDVEEPIDPKTKRWFGFGNDSGSHSASRTKNRKEPLATISRLDNNSNRTYSSSRCVRQPDEKEKHVEEMSAKSENSSVISYAVLEPTRTFDEALEGKSEKAAPNVEFAVVEVGEDENTFTSHAVLMNRSEVEEHLTSKESKTLSSISANSSQLFLNDKQETDFLALAITNTSNGVHDDTTLDRIEVTRSFIDQLQKLKPISKRIPERLPLPKKKRRTRATV